MEKVAVSGRLTLRGRMARAFVLPAKEGRGEPRLWPSATQQRKDKPGSKKIEGRFWRVGCFSTWYRDSPDTEVHETVWCLLVARSPATAEIVEGSPDGRNSPALNSHAWQKVHREVPSLVCL